MVCKLSCIVLWQSIKASVLRPRWTILWETKGLYTKHLLKIGWVTDLKLDQIHFQQYTTEHQIPLDMEWKTDPCGAWWCNICKCKTLKSFRALRLPDIRLKWRCWQSKTRLVDCSAYRYQHHSQSCLWYSVYPCFCTALEFYPRDSSDCVGLI